MTQPRPQGIAALESRPLRLPRKGRLRLGEKETNANDREYPKELDYFNLTDAPAVALHYSRLKVEELERKLRIPGLEEEKQERYQKQLALIQGLLAKILPDELPDETISKALSKALKCRELDIVLPTNDKRAIADTCYMRYGASGPKCRGNGVKGWDVETGEVDCFGEECEYASGDKPSCKRQMIFTFVAFRVPGLCVHDLVTSGWRSIENTLAFLDTLEGMFGRIDGIPLKLYREPYETTRTGKDGKRQKQVHHCIRLDVAASLLDVRRLQLAGGQDLALPEPVAECADDMFPQSLQAAAALPPVPGDPVVIESPPLAAVPDNPELASVMTGFDVVGITDPGEQKRLLDAYEGRLPELDRYLGSLLTDQLPPAQAPSQPARAPRYDQEREPEIEAPKAAKKAERSWSF